MSADDDGDARGPGHLLAPFVTAPGKDKGMFTGIK